MDHRLTLRLKYEGIDGLSSTMSQSHHASTVTNTASLTTQLIAAFTLQQSAFYTMHGYSAPQHEAPTAWHQTHTQCVRVAD